VASTLGAVHYDEDLPWELELFFGLQGDEADALSSFLLRAATVIVGLCKFVLTHAKSDPPSAAS
jgi:hypothetical protein